MEITYDLIINTLTPKNNIYNKFKNIFNKNFIIHENFSKDKNRFWKNILYCLEEKTDDVIIDKLQIDFLSNIEDYYDKLNENFKKLYSLSHVKKLINDENICIYFICQFLKINIIIFNTDLNFIKICFFGEYFNSFKKTILLNDHNDMLNPIITLKKKNFSVNDPIILGILKNNLIYYNKDFGIKYFYKNPNDTYTSEIDKLKKDSQKNNLYTEEKLLKLTKSQLKDILEQELKKKVKNFNKTKKADLVKLILSSLDIL